MLACSYLDKRAYTVSGPIQLFPLTGAQLDCEPLGVSELDMANVNDMASLHSTGLSERLGLEEEEAVSQLGWPSPVTEGMNLLMAKPCYIAHYQAMGWTL